MEAPPSTDEAAIVEDVGERAGESVDDEASASSLNSRMMEERRKAAAVSSQIPDPPASIEGADAARPAGELPGAGAREVSPEVAPPAPANGPPIQCQWCMKKMARSQMKEHLANECVLVKVPCPHGCGESLSKLRIKAHLSECRLAPTKSAGEEADSTKPARGPPPQLPVPEQRADTSADAPAKWQLPATGEDSVASATTMDGRPAPETKPSTAVPGPVRDLIAGLLPDGEPAADEPAEEVESEDGAATIDSEENSFDKSSEDEGETREAGADLAGATSWSYRDLSAHLRDVMRLPEAAQRCESLYVDAQMLLNDFTPDDLCQPPPNGLGLAKDEGAAVLKLITDIKAANG